jgi:asparagine synthase (glutamine-hydrolysing)
MCGIYVVFSASAEKQRCNIENAERGLREINNRGPDYAASLVENEILFGHTRLSIQDTSSIGNQPIRSPRGRYIVVFNGEIYNHLELRRRWLTAETIESKSDTLTIVHLLEAIGVDSTIRQLSGMFAVAIYDTKADTLTIARDRYGEKPIFYSQSYNEIYIYSDPRLINIFNKGTQLDDRALSMFLLTNNIPYPLCAYSGFSKLAPGSFAKFKVGALRVCHGRQPLISSYQYTSYSEEPGTKEASVITTMTRVLGDQLIADRPVAFFLSGGVDSSLLAAVARKEMNFIVDSFAVTFSESRYDESRYSNKIASILGTNHTTLRFRDDDIPSLLDTLIASWGEPFGDSSAIASLFLCKSVSRTHKVAISGDGADEVFYGYNRYKFIGSRLAKAISRSPERLTALIETGIKGTASEWIDYLPFRLPRQKIQKLIDYSRTSRDIVSLYSMLYSMSPPKYCNDSVLSDYVFDFDDYTRSADSKVEALRLLDLLIYLPNDILQKVDISSMAFGLEVRAPYLDPRMIEYADRLSHKEHLDSRSTKKLLRSALAEYIPEKLIDRPKMGFGVPLADYLSSRNVREEVLDSIGLVSPTVFSFMNGESVSNYYSKLFDSLSVHKDSRALHELWNIVVLIKWLKFYGHIC